MADLNEILRAWVADKEGVPRTRVVHVDHEYDEGWAGTDVTPGDEGKFIVHYTVLKSEMRSFDISDLGELIADLADTMRGGPITGPVKTEVPTLGVVEALENLMAEVKLIDNNVSAETRLAAHAAEKALAKWRGRTDG